MTLHVLWKIQELDLELVWLENQLEKDPMTDRLRKVKQVIINMQDRLIVMRDRFDLIKLRGNSIEKELGELRKEIQLTDEKLYSEANSDYEELSVQMEKLEDLKKRFAKTEEVYLEQLEERDSLKFEYKKLKQELNSIQEEFKSLHKMWQENRYKLKGNLKGVTAQKLKLIRSVEELLWLKYRELKKKYRNPLSKVDKGICSGCHIGLSSGDAQKVKSEVILCSFCGRILCPEDYVDCQIG